MPAGFYNATTGIPPVDRVIRQILADGYCHHIERLMVLGNFMLLCRIRPDDVYRWFMELCRGRTHHERRRGRIENAELER